MLRWNQRSSCIICQLRAGYRQYSSSVRHQEYQSLNPKKSSAPARSSTVRRVKSSTIDGYRPVKEPSKTVIRREPVSGSTRTRDGRKDGRRDEKGYGRRSDGRDDKGGGRGDEKYEQKVYSEKRKKIRRALQSAKAYYQTVKMSRSSDVSQMNGLDPDGDLWPEFESLLLGAFDSKSSFDSESSLIGKLMALPSSDFQSNAEREIQFAFLDFVLDRKEAIQVGKGQLNLKYPTEWYPSARQMQRVIHLHVGPTNSGKTYNALKRLEQAQGGFYAGPLRLLAHEVYSRFNDRGIGCDLITGDDVRLSESGQVELYASTVEMVDCGRQLDVGVIDEIQMLGDSDRGWAWTRALLGTQVKELHLCGETRVVPLIREVVASMGDTLHIHQYERLNPLKVMSRSLKGNLQNLRKGDCIVSFSIVNIHALKRQIEIDTGKRCAIVYGGLPPETRAQQAALFNDPDNDYDFLAASDAIGMGLNLSIKRIVFETVSKWNGTARVTLSIPNIKQIAGRAGRYRTAQDDKKNKTTSPSHVTKTSSKVEEPKSIGLVTCIDEADLPVLQRALASEGAPLKSAGILPPGEFYEELASHLPQDTPFEYIMRRMQSIVGTNERFHLCTLSENLDVARAIEEVEGLSVAERLMICAAPASLRTSKSQNSMRAVLLALARAIAADKPVTIADIAELPLEVLDEPITADQQYLVSLESLHKSLILFLWLSYRFTRALRDREMAIRAKELCEEKINTTLLRVSANPKLRQRLKDIRKSSELLREQARAKGWVTDMPLITNPDRTVEEVEAAHALEVKEQPQHEETNPGERTDIEGELDTGVEEIIDAEQNVSLPQDPNSLEESEGTAEGARPAAGFG